MQGGREEAGKIPLEQRAELSSKPLRPPPLPGRLEWPAFRMSGKKSGTAEVFDAFVSLMRQRRFCFHNREETQHERPQMRKTYGVRHHVHGQVPLMDTAEKSPSLSRSKRSGLAAAAGRYLCRQFFISISRLSRHHALPHLRDCLFSLSAAVGAACGRAQRAPMTLIQTTN